MTNQRREKNNNKVNDNNTLDRTNTWNTAGEA